MKRIEDTSLPRLEMKVLALLDTGRWKVSKPVYVRTPFFRMPRFSCEIEEVK